MLLALLPARSLWSCWIGRASHGVEELACDGVANEDDAASGVGIEASGKGGWVVVVGHAAYITETSERDQHHLVLGSGDER
jgi:hypothetical protein